MTKDSIPPTNQATAGDDSPAPGAPREGSAQAAAQPGAGDALDALGSAAWAAVVVSLVVGLPGALRAASAGLSLPLAWLALVGGAAAVLLPLALSFRRLRTGGLLPLGVLAASLGLAAPVCAVLMRVLKANTNHRPLGAATYSMLALIAALGLLAVVSRLGVWAANRPGAAPGIFAGKRSALMLRGLVALGLLAMLYTALPLLSGFGVWVAEALALLAGVTLLSARSLPRVRGPLARAGVGLWLFTIAGCCGVLLSWSGAAVASLQRVAPVCLGVGWLF